MVAGGGARSGLADPGGAAASLGARALGLARDRPLGRAAGVLRGAELGAIRRGDPGDAPPLDAASADGCVAVAAQGAGPCRPVRRRPVALGLVGRPAPALVAS